MDERSESIASRWLAISNLEDSFTEDLQNWPKWDSDFLYHYTGRSGFEGIVRSNTITLRFTKVDCLDDTSEGLFVFEQYKNVINQMHREKLISDSFFEIAQKLEASRIKGRLFTYPSDDEQLNRGFVYDDSSIYTNFIDFLECDAYICCLTHAKNPSYMWENYVRTDDSCGYRLSFDPGRIIGFGHFYDDFLTKNRLAEGAAFQIIYSSDDQCAILRKHIGNIYNFCKDTQNPKEISSLLISMLQLYSLAFKREHFSPEDEYRMVVFMPNCKPAHSVVDLFPCLGDEKKYIEVDFPKDILQEVCLNPQRGSEEKYKERMLFLADRGYNDVELILLQNSQT